MHAIVKWFLRNPTLEVIYLSHAARFSERNSREIRRLLLTGGHTFDPGHNTVAEHRSAAGGTFYAASADQEVIGRGADVVIADDPLAWNDRNIPDKRDFVDETLAFLTTRLNRGGSVFVIMSRMHPDDPIGRRLEGRAHNWVHVQAPAILDEGLDTERALWPEERPLDHLKEIRRELQERGDTRVWESQYQGRPRAALDALFGEPERYVALPEAPGFRHALGADFAYTAGQDSDWFAMVLGRVYGSVIYITDVRRMHCDFTQLASNLRSVQDTHGHCPIFSYVAGPEIGVAHWFIEQGFPVHPLKARFNKRTRAQRTIERWNTGKIRLPVHAPWLNGFLARVRNFTGNENESGDDEIDALVSLNDGMTGATPAGEIRTFGQPRIPR
jgi:phage terminase large subunit-like protein